MVERRGNHHSMIFQDPSKGAPTTDPPGDTLHLPWGDLAEAMAQKDAAT
jgi:hypothetical protein